MRVLNKYEKEYINEEVNKKLDDLLPTFKDLDKERFEILGKIISKDEMFKEVFNFMKRFYEISEIEENIQYNRYWSAYDDVEVCFNLEPNITFKHTYTESEKELYQRFIDKYARITHYRNISEWNFSKYYILFSTWTAPNSERLKKINELIKIIVEDFLKEVK